jgi:hypothetical protein
MKIDYLVEKATDDPIIQSKRGSLLTSVVSPETQASRDQTKEELEDLAKKESESRIRYDNAEKFLTGLRTPEDCKMLKTK